MAQIIQHKRGTLEQLDGVTPNVGELLVVTGSSISALADGLVFVGNSSSDITAVNRILVGTSTPDVTGGDYDNRVDGIPFYNTSTQRLDILQNGGNQQVILRKNSLNLDGTGIVSSSAQVSALAGTSNDEITIAVGGGLNIAESDNSFTLNQTGAQTITINTDGSGIISSSDQIDDLFDIDGLLSSSAQISAFDVFLEKDGDGIVSESAQITGISNSQIASNAAIASSKIDYDGTGIVSESAQITGIANSQIASNAAIASSKIDYDGTGIVSESAQITDIANSQIATNAAIAHSKLANLSSAQVLLGNASNVPTATAISGDIGISNTGVVSITSDSIVDADINSSAAISHTKIDFGGSQLTSGSLGLSIAGGTGTDTVNVGTDTFTFAGTSNEIETTVTNNQVAIGIVTNPTLTGDVIITGDLTVNGDTVQTNVSTMNVEDNIINLNFGGSATDGGLEVTDVTGTLTTGSLLWDGTNDYWKGGGKGSESRLIAEGGSAGTANRVSKFDAAGTIVNSTITDDGTDVTISGELTVSGLANNSFVVTNGSKQLLEVTPSNNGDIIQWNGTSFVASQTIDGGEF